MKYPIKTKFALFFIILFALLLRLINIGQMPLYGDELTMVYDSYSILKTGHDQTGELLPVTFSMGAGRPAGYVYASIPFVALFGPSIAGARALSILSGLGIVYLMFLLGKQLFSERVGIIASLITAVSMWDISLSRGGFETHFALFLVLLATLLFIRAIKTPWLYLVSAALFGMAIHTYPTYKLTLPLFLLVLIWFSGGIKKLIKEKSKRFLVGAFLILAFFASLAIFEMFTSVSEERFFKINVFSQELLREEIVQKVNNERFMVNLPGAIVPLFHNKALEYTSLLTENYFKNLSWEFLFLKGDGNPRHNPGEMGQFYWVEIILISLGGYALLISQRKKFLFILLWIAIAPLATTLLLETHALRNAFMIPPFILLSAVGADRVLNLRGKKMKYLILSGVLLLWILQFIIFLEKLYFVSPNKFARFWSYPAMLASEIATQNRDKYDYILLADTIDNIEYAYPVYNKIHPGLVIEQNKSRTKLNGYLFKKLENVYIGHVPEEKLSSFIEELDGKVLFIGSYERVAGELKDDEILVSKDMTKALLIKRKD